MAAPGGDVPSGDSSHRNLYKNVGRGPDELRRRREEEGVQLRKKKRSEVLQKRRNESSAEGSRDDGDAKDAATNAALTALIEKEMLPALFSDSPDELAAGARKFRKLLCRGPSPPILEVIESGALSRLIDLLEMDDHPTVQFEAAWSLTNIASGNEMHTRGVIEAGAVPILVRLVKKGNDQDIQEQAVWALGNIAGDSTYCRDFVLDAGAMPAVLGFVQRFLSRSDLRVSSMRNGVWTVANLIRGRQPLPSMAAVEASLPVLARYLHFNDIEALTNTCWALSYVCDGPADRIQAAVEAGICRKVVELLEHSVEDVVAAALRTVGNIAAGNDIQTQVVLNCNGLPALRHVLLTTNRKSTRKEVCWTISNIAAGNQEQLQHLVDAGVFPIMLELLKHSDSRTKEEIAYAILHATSGGSIAQIKYLVEDIDCVPPLCDILSVKEPSVLEVTLHALENLLMLFEARIPAGPGIKANPMVTLIEECYGLDKIELLQDHDNFEIYDRAFRIIETYFQVEDDDVIDLDTVPDSTTGMNPASNEGSPDPNFSF